MVTQSTTAPIRDDDDASAAAATTTRSATRPRSRRLLRTFPGISVMIIGMGMYEIITAVSTLNVRSLMVMTKSWEFSTPIKNDIISNLLSSSVTIRSHDAAAAASGFDENDLKCRMNETSITEIDYNEFWREAADAASRHRSEVPMFNLTEDFSCPKVYMYDDLTQNLVDKAKNSGFGKKQELKGSDIPKYQNLLYQTDQYTFPSILKSRLKRYPCRTYDPMEADLLFAPVLNAPKGSKEWNKECSKINGTDVKEALTYLNSTNSCRHFFAMGKGHYNGGQCFGWWRNPIPELVHIQRLAYSERDFEKHTLNGHQYVPEDNTTIEYPNLHSVPYPTSLHFHPSVSESEMSHFHNMASRPSLMSFVGGDHHGDVPVRQLIHAQCDRYNDTSICNYKTKFHNNIITMKGDSIFCLEPAGDSPWRKSIADSIVFGCIPVLFSTLTDDATPWFWDEWKNRGRVLVHREDFLAGRIDLQKLLKSVPPSFLEVMQSTLRERARQFQYSIDTDRNDGISLVLERLHREAMKMEENGDCGYRSS